MSLANGTLPTRWYPLRPHAKQRALWNCSARFVAVAAGRRSGKTELAKRRLVRFLPVTRPWSDPRYFYGAPSQRQAKMIAWEDLLALIPDEWIEGGKNGRNVNRSELWIKTVFGSRLHVIGFDRPTQFEGPPWDGGVMDESSDQKPKTFDLVVRPAVSDRAGWVWRIGVPKRFGPGAPNYRAFFEACSRGEYANGAAFTWPSSDILPPEEVAQARETLDTKDFNEQFNASWETAGGAIFHAFNSQANVRPVPYIPGKPIIVGCDFNVDPMCWVIGHRYEKRLEWFDELWIRDTNTQATLDVLWAKYQDHKGGFEFYGDAAGKARSTKASASDYQQILNDKRFQAAGRAVHFPDANPAQKDRFAACNAMFCNADGDRRMYVDPRCKRLITDLETRAFKPGTTEPNDSGDVGHITDAMGYPTWKLFPIRLDEPTKPGQVIIRKG